jgi:hypothetical protein
MTQELFPQHWINNTLLDDGFITQKATELLAKPIPYGLDAWLAAHFNSASLSVLNEAQLEDKLIGPLLTQLGWTKVTQEPLIVQGKQARLVFAGRPGARHRA